MHSCSGVTKGTERAVATRTRSDLHIFVSNSSFGKRRIKYKCSVLWIVYPIMLKFALL